MMWWNRHLGPLSNVTLVVFGTAWTSQLRGHVSLDFEYTHGVNNDIYRTLCPRMWSTPHPNNKLHPLRTNTRREYQNVWFFSSFTMAQLLPAFDNSDEKHYRVATWPRWKMEEASFYPVSDEQPAAPTLTPPYKQNTYISADYLEKRQPLSLSRTDSFSERQWMKQRGSRERLQWPFIFAIFNFAVLVVSIISLYQTEMLRRIVDHRTWNIRYTYRYSQYFMYILLTSYAASDEVISFAKFCISSNT